MEQFDYKKFLVENRLTPNSRLLAEVSIEILQNQYVDSGKLEQEVFDEIIKASSKKSAYATWLAKKVADGIIKDDDVSDFKKYFSIFNRNKKLFPKSDINQYKTPIEVDNFIYQAIEIADTEFETTGGEYSSNNGLVTPNNVRKLEKVGIEFLGLQDGYQIFKIPEDLAYEEEAWELYRRILGRCSGRSEGNEINLCTLADPEVLGDYLESGPLYVIFNMKDRLSPYQFQYDSDSFRDNNDEHIA